MKYKYPYTQPVTTIIDIYTDDMMKDFVPFSETEVIDGPPVNTNPNDGVYPEDALTKGYSVWDE